METAVIIELHLLQSFPVSNLNRDDIGQPKTAKFGGHTRGRISSQCLKASARKQFKENGCGLHKSEIGQRTKRLHEKAAERLTTQGRDAIATDLVVGAGLECFSFTLDEQTRRTKYQLFTGQAAAEFLADYCDLNWDRLHKYALDKREAKRKEEERKKRSRKEGDDEQTTRSKAAEIPLDKATRDEVKRLLDAGRVADIALFGRMIADNTEFNVAAASQVAHAISTHAVVNEFDYYTAMDDLKPDAEPGADMIGTVDFNAACYYRYANLDLEQLQKNLKGDTDLVGRAASAWLRAFINAMPSGKQTSMAARTMPEVFLGVAREHGAWNLANAFLEPVNGTQGDLMAASADRLFTRFMQLRRFYGGGEIHAVAAASIIGDVPHVDEGDVVQTVDDFTARMLSAAGA